MRGDLLSQPICLESAYVEVGHKVGVMWRGSILLEERCIFVDLRHCIIFLHVQICCCCYCRSRKDDWPSHEIRSRGTPHVSFGTVSHLCPLSTCRFTLAQIWQLWLFTLADMWIRNGNVVQNCIVVYTRQHVQCERVSDSLINYLYHLYDLNLVGSEP
jgi:hypothetical protein